MTRTGALHCALHCTKITLVVINYSNCYILVSVPTRDKQTQILVGIFFGIECSVLT